MKKIISISTIALLLGMIAIGCSTPEESGKTGETAGTSSTAGAGDAGKEAKDSAKDAAKEDH